MGEFSLEEAMLFSPTSETGKDLVYTDDVSNLVISIAKQVEAMNRQGFDARFVLLNKRNYEKLVTYANHHAKERVDSNGLIDEIFGLTVVVWDVPIDYVNVRAKASVEFAYNEEVLRKGV